MKTNLSVGVPTYNQGEFIEETLNSILNQSILPDQIVISNNHSNDVLTDKVLKKFENNKLVKIIKPPEFLKMCSNWHFTAMNCDCKFFTLISSDDVLEKNFVEEFIKSKNNNCLFYRFNFNLINNNGEFISNESLRSVPRIQQYPNNLLNQLLGPKAGFPAFVISKKLYEDVGGYDVNFNFYADWHLLLKIAEKTDFYHINKTTTNYRVNYREGLLYSRAKNGGIDDIIYIFNYLLKCFNDKGFNKFKFFLKSSIAIHMSSFLMLLKSDDKEEIDKINEFITKNKVKTLSSNMLLNSRRNIVRLFELYLKFFKIN